jgi:hypothetical protein
MATGMTESRVSLEPLSSAERRDLANALLRAAWSAALNETRVLLLDFARRDRRCAVGGRVNPFRTMSTELAVALIDALDDDALIVLAQRLEPYMRRVEDGEALLTPALAARRLRVHPKTLTRAAAAGRVHGAVRAGRSWRFRADLLALDPPSGVRLAPAPLTARATRTRRSGRARLRTRHQGPGTRGGAARESAAQS